MGKMTITICSRKHYGIMEDSIMPAIIAFPTVVKDALETFGPFFVNEPERKHSAGRLRKVQNSAVWRTVTLFIK